MMRRKGIFTILTAVVMVLAFAGLSFAANQVTLKTTVPNIPKSECYQAGNDTMEFDDLTQIREGDVIQFTLNNKVTVCKSLNMWLRISNDGPGAAQTLDLTADAPVSTTGGTVSDPLTGMWGFLIQATNADTVAGQIITATLQRRLGTGALVPSTGAIMTFNGTLATDKLIVKLFDGKIAGTESAFLKPLAATPTLYDTAIVTGDNALCIDTLTQNFLEEYVQNTPDSLPINVAQRLTFSGDYRIAHILSELVYSVFTCKGAAAGNILLGSSGQSSSSCVAFDFEAAAPNGYCTNHSPSKFVLQSSQPYEVTQYTLRMEILVNGLTGEHGVYWSNVAPQFGHYTTSSDACVGAGLGAFAGVSYLRGDGSTTAVPVAPIAANCAGVATGAKAVRIDTAATSLFTLGDSFLYVDFPSFNYNLAEVQAGDVVSVRVTVSKATCGVVGTFTIPVGTFACPSGPSPTGKLLFTYFTSLSADDFWNGIAIINNTSAGGTATLTAYEKDGSVATATVPVPAKGMYVNLLESITWSGSGLGGQQCYITVNTDYASPDGFGMIAKETSGESMGYLPRQTF